MTPPEGIVFVVDDDLSVRESMGGLIRSAGFKHLAFSSAKEFLAYPDTDVPACLVLDVSMPGLSGLDLQRKLIETKREIPIVFITGHGDIPMSVKAIKAGAAEFLVKPVSSKELLKAIQDSIRRDQESRKDRSKFREWSLRYESLTPREKEVMGKVVLGLLNKQIAAELGTSEVTVKVHRGKVMHKMRADSVATLVRMSEKLSG